MKALYVIWLLSLSWQMTVAAGEFRGRVIDAQTGSPVAAVRIIADCAGHTLQTLTSKSGVFTFFASDCDSLTVSLDRYGYRSERLQRLHANSTALIKLQPDAIRLPGVVVEAVRGQNTAIHLDASQPQTGIDATTTSQLPGTDAAAALAIVPGAFVRQYGGMSGLKTLSMRGFAASQTAISIDGIRIDDSQTGSTDLTLLDLDMFPAMQVRRGGNSSASGANAVAGSINFPINDEGPGQQKIEATTGAYGTRAVLAELELQPTPKQHLSFLAKRHRHNGDHRFHYRAFGENHTLHRNNADLSKQQALYSWRRSSEQSRIHALLFAVSGERGVPGPALQGRVGNTNARQWDELYLTGINLQQRLASGWQLQFQPSLRRQSLRYRDPELAIRAGGVDDRYDQVGGGLRASLQRVRGRTLIVVGLQQSVLQLDGSNLARSSVSRYETQFSMQGTWIGAASDRLQRVEAGLRVQRFSGLATAIGPALGLNLLLPKWPMRWRVHASHNYRVPTFAELYYRYYGNANLRPEQSWTFESGLAGQLTTQWPLDWELTAYHIRSRDQILAIPLSPVAWSTRNLGRSQTTGIEAAIAIKLANPYRQLRLSYARQQPIDITPDSRTHGKILPYAAQELLSGLAIWQQKFNTSTLSASLAIRYTSHRFHLAQNQSNSVLPSYMLTDARIAIERAIASQRVQLWLEFENLFDREYEIIRNYPMPLRLWRSGLSWSR